MTRLIEKDRYLEPKLIGFEKKQFVCTITLNLPESLNDLSLCSELQSTITSCQGDKQIRVVILTGAGKVFCNGFSIRAMETFIKANPLSQPSSLIDEMAIKFHPIILAIRGLNKPVIGAINGFCSGGGAALALACDILVAAESAKIQVPYFNIGKIADGGNSLFLVQELGLNKATELLFTGDILNASEAYKFGIFNRVVPDKELIMATEKMARKIAHGSAYAIALTKNMLSKAVYGNLETQLAIEKKAVISCAERMEFKEGISAFFEKRMPNFIGVMDENQE